MSSYFDILIQYGNQHETLGFRDLIELKSRGETDLDIELRNPEYDITRSIKKVIYEFQGTGDVFSNINSPVSFTGYISEDIKIPTALSAFKKEVKSLLKELQESSQGKLSFSIKLFFQSYVFSFLLRKKTAESPESQPDEPDFFYTLS